MFTPVLDVVSSSSSRTILCLLMGRSGSQSPGGFLDLQASPSRRHGQTAACKRASERETVQREGRGGGGLKTTSSRCVGLNAPRIDLPCKIADPLGTVRSACSILSCLWTCRVHETQSRICQRGHRNRHDCTDLAPLSGFGLLLHSCVCRYVDHNSTFLKLERAHDGAPAARGKPNRDG